MSCLQQFKAEKIDISAFLIIRRTAIQAARRRRYRLLWIAAAPGRLPRAWKLLRQRPLSTN
jgi:hypothetical protein